jgi:hypothetical protein
VATKKSDRIWDYLGSICHTKDLSVLEDPDFDKVYQPYLINRALSQHEDSVLAAQLMNERSEIPPAVQFRFLAATLRSRKRYGKWLKHEDDAAVGRLAEYYECSIRQARRLIDLHTPEQLQVIQARLNKGR